MSRYETAGTEPTIEEVMSDPVVRHLRHFDGLDPFFRPEPPKADAETLPLPQAA